MFKAIQRTNNVTLCALAKTFIEAGNDVAVLLCLDHVFSSPLELQNLPLTEVQSLLSLYLAYVRLLNQFWRDGSLVEGSNHQRLFGFQVLGENRYLVPKYTLLHEKLTDRSGPGKRGVDGYRCSYDELFQAIIRLISSRSRGRTEIQNSVCRDVYGFSPCLRLLVQRKCNPPNDQGPCPFHHIQLEELTVDWYHTRLHLILLQFKILDSARYYDLHVTKYVLAHLLYEKCVWILIKRKATGLGYCTQHFTHLIRGSGHLRILTLAVYLMEPIVSGSYENGFATPAMISGITIRDQRTVQDNGSRLRVRWPSTSIEKMPGNLSLARLCTGRRCGRDPCFVGGT